jgi:hypothetical protein
MSAKETIAMKTRRAGVATAAILMLAAVPATLGIAQTQTQPPAARPGGPPAEVRARLRDGRIAMIKEALRLDETQLKLWAPVETQLRAAFAARQKARADRRERWERRDGGRDRPSLADRLDRRSQRLTERAERTKALADAFRPFYASLSDEQKAVAGVVLRPAVGGPRRERRWAARRAFRADER